VKRTGRAEKGKDADVEGARVIAAVESMVEAACRSPANEYGYEIWMWGYARWAPRRNGAPRSSPRNRRTCSRFSILSHRLLTTTSQPRAAEEVRVDTRVSFTEQPQKPIT